MTASARVVSIHYTLTDDKGTVLDSSQGAEPLQYLEGAGNIIPGLEKEVSKMNTGDKKKVKIPAAQAYGEKREDMVMEVPRTQVPPDMALKVGDGFRGGAEDHAPVFTVMAVNGDKITLDGNHPLAGQDLNFDVEVTEARAATAEEVSHGHAHGPHGHHH
ncbi:MAG: FKBP-type peptidyl-prolyl cis-trans isomerase [Bdellovibrionota bacterium]